MAVAVSAAVMMPVGAQAEATVYGRINNAIVFEDTGGKGVKSTTDMRSIGSRFGVKANSDLGNGLTAHGQYEFATTTDKSSDGITGTRIATAGLSGGFGRIDVGEQWSAFYNAVGVDIDPTWFVGPVGGTPYRASNTIKYSNSVGPLNLELDLRQNDGKDGTGKNNKKEPKSRVSHASSDSLLGNGAGLGIRVAATDNITFAFGYDTEKMKGLQTVEKRTRTITEREAVETGQGYTISADDLTFAERIGLTFEDKEETPNKTYNPGVDDLVWEGRNYAAQGEAGSKYYCLDSFILDRLDEAVAENNRTAGATDRDNPAEFDSDGNTDGIQEQACSLTSAIPAETNTEPHDVTETGDYEYDRIAASMNVSIGQFWGNLFWSSKEVTYSGYDVKEKIAYSGLYVGANFTDSTSGMIGYSQSKVKGGDSKPSKVVLGLYHNMGGGLRLWYEGGVTDHDEKGRDDQSAHYLGIRYDF